MKEEKQKYHYKDKDYWQWGCCEFNNKDRQRRFGGMPFWFNADRNFLCWRSFRNKKRFREK